MRLRKEIHVPAIPTNSESATPKPADGVFELVNRLEYFDRTGRAASFLKHAFPGTMVKAIL